VRQADGARFSISLSRAGEREDDALLVEPIEPFEGGELGIENEILGGLPYWRVQKAMKRKMSSGSSPLRPS
jgi:hypothetical protein